MTVKEFEEKIKHLSQNEITTYAIDTIGCVLIEKNIATKDEFQDKFLEIMEKRADKKLPKKRRVAKDKKT